MKARLPLEAVRVLSIRVAIADDQALVRAGFRKLLEVDPEIEVVGEAGDGSRRSRPCSGCAPMSS